MKRLLSLLLLIAACKSPTPPQLPAGIAVEHFKLNRCASARHEACASDRDCHGKPCVSVLMSTGGGVGRDGGHTVAVGERVLWLFGDTFTATGLRSLTAAWSDRRDPLNARDVTDKTGLSQFVPFTADEKDFNSRHQKPMACCREKPECPADQPYCHCPKGSDCVARVALWPGDGIATGEHSADIYYEKYRIGVAPYDYQLDGVGIAAVGDDGAVATRIMAGDGQPLHLFQSDEPNFTRGVQVQSADGSFFHLHGNRSRGNCIVDVYAARVPSAQMRERAAYRFWDGKRWSAELVQAQPIAAGIAGGLGSIVWNEQLGSYLSVWSDVCTKGNLALRVAASPEGPWSAPTQVDLASLGVDERSYYGFAHPQMAIGTGLLISYFQPLGGIDGQLRLARLILPSSK